MFKKINPTLAENIHHNSKEMLSGEYWKHIAVLFGSITAYICFLAWLGV